MSIHPPDAEDDPQLHEYLSSLDTDQLLSSASKLRPGFECRLGGRIVGGYNVIFEILFSDGVVWLARCPLPHHCSSQHAADNLLQSYAATLKYLKLKTSIPVPEVFASLKKSDSGNYVGTSYLLMERLPGHPIDMQDVYKCDDGYEQAYASAKKVFRQLAHYIMQLASLQFDKIGSLQERPAGSSVFFIDEYLDAGIDFPPERGKIYEALATRGPFSTVSEYHSAILSLNEKYAVADEDDDYALAVRYCRLLEPLLTLPQYDLGPFVLNHDDLSSSNVLVDDEYNITGLIDFPGTTAPLPSLSVYPSIFEENSASPFTDRRLWLECMLDAQSVPGSTLNNQEVRKSLMAGALDRGTFEAALRHTYAYISVAPLAQDLGVKIEVADESIRTELRDSDEGKLELNGTCH